jgi:hypothetical protein
MKTSPKQKFAAVVVLLFGLAAATPAFAITGCTNQNIMGTYNAQISSAAFTGLINTLSASAAGSTTTPIGGFGGNSASIAGNTPALSRFYFDGNGSILGVTGSNTNLLTPAGTYSVATDCTATITLNSGQHYNAVVVSSGNQVLFLQSDAKSNGVTGTLQRSSSSCSPLEYPTSFGFSFSGAAATAASTGGSTTTPTIIPYSSIGVLSLDSAGNFTVTDYLVTSSGASQTFKGSGTATLNSNCVLSLTFATPVSGTSGALIPPAGFATLIGLGANGQGYSGMITVQPTTGVVSPGVLISQ